MHRFAVVALAALMLLGACSTRSISNSGYPAYGSYNAFYRGELNEMDVLMPDSDVRSTDAVIAATLADGSPVVATLHKPLLAVQSGALAPDSEMLTLLRPHFAVAPFSGIPPEDGTAYGRRLRLAAAQGGFSHILVYWGALEAERSGGVTKAISWVPIVGAVIPDETQNMRIVLKAVVIDVATGRWHQVAPAPIEDERLSASINRGDSDQGQVERLKEAGYARLVEMLVDEASLVANR